MVQSLTKVSIIIPVHNRREITLQALRSLSRADISGLELLIIIVDDGSSDGTSDVISREFPEIRLIRGDGTLHYAGGTNRGILDALDWKPDYLVLMNDDAVFHDQFLQHLVNTARKELHSVIGALLLLWNEPHRVFQVRPVWNTLKGGWQFPTNLTVFDFPKQPFPVESIVGNCVLVPVEAVRECGLMDAERFPHGWGDAQYFVKLRKAGWRLLVNPRAYVWCEPNTYPKPFHQTSISRSLRILFSDERHPGNLKRQFVARWHSAPTRTAAVTAFAIYCLSLLGKSFQYGIKGIKQYFFRISTKTLKGQMREVESRNR